ASAQRAGGTRQRMRPGLPGPRVPVPHTGSMDAPGLPEAAPPPDAAPMRRGGVPGPAPLPERMQLAVDGLGRHLAAARGLAPLRVRAYLGDIRWLLEHAAGDAITAPDGLDIAVLRRWLASQHGTGHARATLARRAAAARAFTAWASASGWLSPDPGLLLGTAKVRRRLPRGPRQDQMTAVPSSPPPLTP